MGSIIGAGVAGLCAGALNGLFGAGGGMVLVPIMQLLTKEDDQTLFSSGVVILFPICILSLIFAGGWQDFRLASSLPYLAGSLAGGVAAGVWGKAIPVKWLHRVLGVLILWGGIRYIW